MAKIDFEALKANAEQGDAQAQRELGKAYASGKVSWLPPEKKTWLHAAADRGNKAAQFLLGAEHLYQQTTPVVARQNRMLAYFWLSLSARAGANSWLDTLRLKLMRGGLEPKELFDVEEMLAEWNQNVSQRDNSSGGKST
ncbi:MAG TPA: hypothetical protein VL625_11445 [Patescibacteria group bacterium]|jgi:TPR repeat protein|nr:hypothetical protein [Patescibacteria group bacterium]